MTEKGKPPATRRDVNAFLQQAAATPVANTAPAAGRLIFALDATASREATWDHASQLQAEMFDSTARLGGLEIQLCYYRGFREFHASAWCRDSRRLLREMTAVRCLAGHTQIARLQRHAIEETRRRKVNAVVFIGDCVEEPADTLGDLAGQLGLLGVPLFLFHEGHDPHAAGILRQLARLSGGAYGPFDAGSARQLRQLLGEVAVYAAGGLSALEDFQRRQGHRRLRLGRD